MKTHNLPRFIRLPIYTIRYAYRSIKWLVAPPRCSVCDVRMHISNPSTSFGKLTLKNMKSHVCNLCVASKIYDEEVTGASGTALRHGYDTGDTCDCCGHPEPSYRFMSVGGVIDLRFCIRIWNGVKVCKSCVITALTHGKQTTEFFSRKNKNIMHVNREGLFLDQSGKVKLFMVVDF